MSVKEQISKESIEQYNEYLKPLKKLRKKQGWGIIFFYLVCVVIGILIGVSAAKWDKSGVFDLNAIRPFELPKGLGILYYVAFVLYIIVTMPLHTIIHEAGHLVFGLLSGYRFLSFRIFSFTIVKKGGKIAIKKLKVLGTMGQCLMYPPEWKEEQKYPYVLYNLGGGLLNLISCVLVTPLFFTGSPLWIWIAGLFVFFGLIFAITNVVPMTLGIPNDGKNCLDCMRSKEAKRALYLQLKINADMSDGAELTDFPIEWFEVQEQQGKKISALISYLYLQKYCWYQAQGQKEKTEEMLDFLEKNRERLITAYVNTIDLERLGIMVQEKAPIEKIAAYYTVLRPVLIQNTILDVQRIKYAYYLCLSEEEREMIDWLTFSKKGKLPRKLPKQKPITAEKIYEEMEKAAKKHPVAGEARLQMQLAKEIKEKYSNDY